MVYPQGTKLLQRWNAGPGWADADVDDVQFLRDMIADVSAVAAMEPRRVYVNGFSNGGGMAQRIFMGANWVPDWAEINGCDPTPETFPAPGDVAGVRYTGCQDGAEVIFYTVVGAGHTWPGSWPIPGGLGKTSQDIDATEELWAFFQWHRLEGQP